MGGPHEDTTGSPDGEKHWAFPDVETAVEAAGFTRLGTLGARDTPPIPPDSPMAPRDREWMNRAMATSGIVYWHPGLPGWLEVSGWLDDRPVLRLFSTYADGRIVMTRSVFHRMPNYDGRELEDGAVYARAGHAPRGGVFVEVLPVDATLTHLVEAHARSLAEQSGTPLTDATITGAVDTLDRFVDHRVVQQVERVFQRTAIGSMLGVMALAVFLFAGVPFIGRAMLSIGFLLCAFQLPYQRLPLVRSRPIGPPRSPLVHMGNDDSVA